MYTRSLKMAAIAAAIAAAPMIGAAANSPTALNSCTKAFVADLAAKTPTTLKLRDSHYVDSGTSYTNLTVLGGRKELALTARDAHDNHAVARAVCTVNSQGVVIDLYQTPVFASEPY